MDYSTMLKRLSIGSTYNVTYSQANTPTINQNTVGRGFIIVISQADY